MWAGLAQVTSAYRKEGLLSAQLNRDHGRCRQWSRQRIQLLLILFSLVFFGVTPGGAREPKARKVLGLTMDITPARVTILAVDGTEITVIPREDFTEKVAVGSQVTVWYVPEGGVNKLRWLQYPLENFFFSANEIRLIVRKVVVLPTSDVPDAGGLFAALAQYLQTNAKWQVELRELAEGSGARAPTPGSTLDTINPATGEVDLKQAVQITRDSIRKQAAEAHADAILEVHVEEVQADYMQYTAAWDGVEQSIGTGTAKVLSRISAIPAIGQVPAATVVLKLRDARGRMLWSNRRGFAALERQDRALTKFRTRTLSEVLEDTPWVQKWFATVFGSLLPRVMLPAKAVAK